MDRHSLVFVCVRQRGQRRTLVYLHVYARPYLDAWSTCIRVGLLSFWPLCPNLPDRKLSNVDYFEVESFDLFKSTLCSEQANAGVLWGQPLSLLMLLLYSSFVLSALSVLLSLSSLFLCPLTPSFFLPPLPQLPLSLFSTYIMTWTMSWQHKEPSDCVSAPAPAPLSHRQCVEHALGVVWFNETGFYHCWLLKNQNIDVLYEQTADSHVGFIRADSPSKKRKFGNDSPVIFERFLLHRSSIWKWQYRRIIVAVA